MVAPKMMCADVGRSTIPLSLSKAQAATFAKANDDAVLTSVEAGHKNSGSKILRIGDLPDPHGCYAGLLKTYGGLTDAKVTMPDMHNTWGVLITPVEYDSKISDGNVVEVEVILKLWSIQPNSRGNPNSSRIYQMILQSMKLLPFNSYLQQNLLQHTYPQPLPAADKGKCKADGNETLAGQLPNKKCVPVLHVSAAVEEMDIGGEEE
ncbi:hypothetical protein EDD16DRAFT_1702750 [Pisolithus croceorrhizus]|nr:hypothetical protein EDD16DRAFT_1702750 [Pisolithus croceorrhizus]KAI6167453.1 hypothetical protein EDD17DRAFT_1752007 [Pisolithus thermaeus]